MQSRLETQLTEKSKTSKYKLLAVKTFTAWDYSSLYEGKRYRRLIVFLII